MFEISNQNKRAFSLCASGVLCRAISFYIYIHINYYYWTPSIFKTPPKKNNRLWFVIYDQNWLSYLRILYYPFWSCTIDIYFGQLEAVPCRLLSIFCSSSSLDMIYIIYICGVFTVVLIVSFFLFFCCFLLFFGFPHTYRSPTLDLYTSYTFYLSVLTSLHFFFCLSFLSISIPFSSLFVLSPSLFV